MVEGERHSDCKQAFVAIQGGPDLRVQGFNVVGRDAFFDFRGTYPYSASQLNMKFEAILTKHENEKRKKYNPRIRQAQNGDFLPMVFSITGVWSKLFDDAICKVAKRIALRTRQDFSSVITVLRTKLSFACARSMVRCLRGTRRRAVRLEEEEIDGCSESLLYRQIWPRAKLAARD